MSLLKKLKPFYGKRCQLTIDESLGENAANHVGETWELFVFDWARASEENRATIYERANWEGDELAAFAVLNPGDGADDLDEILASAPENEGIAGKFGFLFATDEGVQVGDGDLWPLAENEDAFVAALRVA